jgi:hypothetical protein
MTVSTPVKLFSALAPIAVSPVFFALGPAGQGGYFFGLLLGAFFGVTLALPYRRAA